MQVFAQTGKAPAVQYGIDKANPAAKLPLSAAVSCAKPSNEIKDLDWANTL